ncbi:MAG: T9SS type A sorting domain-containing protein, partial [Bacteroidota bacterium]
REVFETISVETRCFDALDGQSISAIFPNPVVEGKVNIKMLSQLNDENVNLLLYDALGKLVDNRNVQLVEGENLLTIDLKSMVNGVYTIQLQGSGWFSQPQKFFYIQR